MLRQIGIKAVLNGWIVSVGCQIVVFQDMTEMLEEISLYLDDPDKTEKRYRENAVNAAHTNFNVLCETDEVVRREHRDHGDGCVELQVRR